MTYPTEEGPSNHAHHGDDLKSELKQIIKEPSKQLFIKERLNQSGLTKLKVESLRLVGRETEVQLLKDALERLVSSRKQRRELVLLKGQSGTGKSSLSGWAEKHAKVVGAIVVSKHECDTTTRDHPYAGIASLGNKLLCSMMSEDDNLYQCSKQERIATKETFCQRVLETFDAVELALIGNITPSLRKLIPSKTEIIQTETKADIHSPVGEMKGRQMLAIQKFICMVASIVPLLLVVDDLQWIDAESLELIRGIMTTRDLESSTMMILGCYTTSEADDESQDLSKVIRDIEKQDNATLTKVTVSNLSIEAVQTVFATLLNTDDKKKIKPLAELCHRRTLGNVFFLLSFITMLRDKEYLTFSVPSVSWHWDIDTIERETDATKNVVDLIMGQLEAATPGTRTLLQVATCFGSRVEKDVLYKVWVATNKAEAKDQNSFSSLLDSCRNEKYLETSDGVTYGFVHGKIQESVTNSASRDELQRLQWRIGFLLSDELNLEDETNHIFVVANLLNKSWTGDKVYVRERLIQLNLKAAARAMGFSAYITSSHYAGMGIKYWEDEMWKTHRPVGVSLYSIAAKSKLSIGHWEKAEEYCNEVLERKDLSLLEKSALYSILMDLKCNPLKQHEEALDIALRVLQQLDCRFPKYSLTRASVGLKHLYKLRHPPAEEEIAKLPLMKDPVKLMAANMMSKAFPLTHYTKSILLAVLLSVRMVRWTMEFGITDDSPSAFAAFGMMIQQLLGDFENGSKYCDIAISMLDKTQTRKKHAHATLLAVMGLAFSKPIPSLLGPLLNGYKAGMEHGDIEMAMWDMNSYLTMQLYCGKLLKHVNRDFEVYIPQMKALQQSEPHDCTIPSWDVTMELAGLTDHRTKSLMTDAAVQDNSEESKELFLPVHTLFRHAILGQYELGAKCATEKVVKHVKKMQSIVKKGNPNAVHHAKFLDAEHEALSSRSKAALDFYQEAISFAGRLGFLQDVALANERYAQLLLRSSDPDLDTEEASFRIQESIKYYSEWGAERKVRLLEVELSQQDLLSLAMAPGSNGATSKREDTSDASAIFSRAAFETALKSGDQETDDEASKWYEKLAPEEQKVLDDGMAAICYRGCMIAAKRSYDTLVRQKQETKRAKNRKKKDKTKERKQRNNRQNQRQEEGRYGRERDAGFNGHYGRDGYNDMPPASTNRVEALGDGSGDLTSGTNTTTKDEGDDIIVGRSLLEVEVLTGVVDTRGGAIQDRRAVTTVATDQDGILTVGTAVVRQDGDGHIHEVGREEGEGVITRMAEIEDDTVRLDRDHGIEAWFQRIGAIHMPATTIVIK
ncbi:MAG: hypothetical protein SGBAC_007527 [Bacillariaceae sp.]